MYIHLFGKGNAPFHFASLRPPPQGQVASGLIIPFPMNY